MKTVIIYASKYGSTKHSAEILAKYLSNKPTLINISEAENLNIVDLTDFDCIVLGSPIYAGKPLRAMQDFYAANKEILIQKKLGLFINCINSDKTTIKMQLQNAYPSELRNHAVALSSFGGVLDPSKLTMAEKTILKIINKPSRKDTLDETTIIKFAKDLSN